jgi:hypothetical protein
MAPNRSSSRQQEADLASRTLPSASSNGVARVCLGRVSRSGWRPQPRKRSRGYVKAAARYALSDLAHFLFPICIPTLANRRSLSYSPSFAVSYSLYIPYILSDSSPTSELPQSTTPPHSDVHPHPQQPAAATRLSHPSQVLPRACRFARHTATRRDIPLPAVINTVLAAATESSVNSTLHRSSHGTLSSLRPERQRIRYSHPRR